jgi:hypothetical protein
MDSPSPSLRLSAHFGQWLQVGSLGRHVGQWQVAAGLISGQVKKSSRRRKLVRVSHVMRLGTEDALTAARPRIGPLGSAQHRHHFAGQSDHSTWKSRSRTPHLGHGQACPAPAGPPGMVAGFLSCCASSPLTASGAGFATRARWQTDGAALSAADACHGSWKNHPTMDDARGALLPRAFAFRLRATTARCSCTVLAWSGECKCQQKKSDGASLQEKMASSIYPMTKKPARSGFAEGNRILHHVQ